MRTYGALREISYALGRNSDGGHDGGDGEGELHFAAERSAGDVDALLML